MAASSGGKRFAHQNPTRLVVHGMPKSQHLQGFPQRSQFGLYQRHVNAPCSFIRCGSKLHAMQQPRSPELRCAERKKGLEVGRVHYRSIASLSSMVDSCHRPCDPLAHIIDLDRPWVSNLVSVPGPSLPCALLLGLPSLFALALVISCSEGKSCPPCSDCSGRKAS